MTAPVKPPYRVPLMSEIEAVKWNGFTACSTFSGAGGSCLGYRMAGFKVAWASEFVAEAAETYRVNAPSTILDGRDIRTVTGQMILDAIGLGVGELDLLDGSPPCASFSTAGARQKHWGQVTKYSSTEQRTDDLFWEFARLVEEIRPRVFIAENVSGLAKGVAKGYFLRILARLKECGYRVEAKRLDASWLGVPQARQRIFFVGVRNDLDMAPAFPKPLPYQYTVRDALPWITAQGASGTSPFGQAHMQDATQPSPTIGSDPSSGNGRCPPSMVTEDLIGITAGDVIIHERAETKGGKPTTTVHSGDEPSPTLAAHGMSNAARHQVGVIAPRGSESQTRLEVERWPGHYADDVSDGQIPTLIAGTGTAGGTSDGLRVVTTTPAPGAVLAERQFDHTLDDVTDQPAPTVQAGEMGHGGRSRQFRVIHDTSGLMSHGDMTDRPAFTITSGSGGSDSLHYKVAEIIDGEPAVVEPGPDQARVVHDTDGDWGLGDITDRPAPTITPGGSNGTRGGRDIRVIHDPGGQPEYARGDVTDRAAATITSQDKEFKVSDMSVTRDPETGEDITLGRYAIGKEWQLMRRRRDKNSGKYTNLKIPDEDEPSQSITAMGGVVGAAGVTHWAECRKLTLLELRRLGGFPDDFQLTGNYRQRWERIGRAVPPPMMAALAAEIRDRILIPLREAGRI